MCDSSTEWEGGAGTLPTCRGGRFAGQPGATVPRGRATPPNIQKGQFLSKTSRPHPFIERLYLRGLQGARVENRVNRSVRKTEEIA
ncbi:MAG: hypothetical protein ACI9NQ_000504 [Paracoccaceae bacterium]